MNPLMQSLSQHKSMVQPKQSLLPSVEWKRPKRRTAGDEDLTQFVTKLVTIFLPMISSKTPPSEEASIKSLIGNKFWG